MYEPAASYPSLIAETSLRLHHLVNERIEMAPGGSEKRNVVDEAASRELTLI